jgi:hypothetical protein
MADIWRLRALNADTDLAGYEVEADDGDIGKIAEATNHVDASWIVVDTGFWIFGKRRMIPAGAISRIDVEDRKVYVDLSKDQIKGAPDYDASVRDAEEYRQQVGTYYRRWPTWEGKQATGE